MDEIESLSRPIVQDYIFANENADETQFVLKNSVMFNLPINVIANQLKGRRKSRFKLPTYFKTRGIIYPPSVNLEQSSSEATASFKANLLASWGSKTIADLTSGFGIDSYFFSKTCDHVTAVEVDYKLLKIAEHNHMVLERYNVTYKNLDAGAFLQASNEKFDCIFVDPSRRDGSHRRVFKFSDCHPNVIELFDLILDKTSRLFVKASPLIDLQRGITEFIHVEKIFVLSVDNDCKEVLFLCNKDYIGEPEIIATELTHNTSFAFRLSEERGSQPSFSDPLKFIYEPGVSILKAGAFKLVAEKFSLKKIHPNTHLYTSLDLVDDFPGRIFENLGRHNDFTPRLAQANVLTRNYPLTANLLKKKLGLKDGGEYYVLGFTGQSAKHISVAKRIK